LPLPANPVLEGDRAITNT